jgi:hypothetical protein
LRCEVAGCNFESKSLSVRHQSIAETLLVGHTKKVHGEMGFYGVDPPSTAKAVVTNVIDDIVNGAVYISEKMSEHDSYNAVVTDVIDDIVNGAVDISLSMTIIMPGLLLMRNKLKPKI